MMRFLRWWAYLPWFWRLVAPGAVLIGIIDTLIYGVFVILPPLDWIVEGLALAIVYMAMDMLATKIRSPRE